MLSALAHRLAHWTGWSVRRAQAQRAMRIVMLHGIGPDDVAALRAQLAWLRANFEPVSLAELALRLDDPSRISGREVALTFDDGLRNNAELAAPLLAEHQVPATFFVCPGLIESGRWLWNHEARERLRASPVALSQAAGALECGAAVEAVIDEMKATPISRRREVEDLIRAATATFAPTDTQRMAYDVMSWDAVRALDTRWISIGSHTVDHPILTTLDRAGIDDQLASSRTTLEDRLDRSCPWFCYPNGAEDERVRASARAHYDLAVTTEPGVVRDGADRHGLARIGAPDDVSTLAWRFHRP